MFTQIMCFKYPAAVSIRKGHTNSFYICIIPERTRMIIWNYLHLQVCVPASFPNDKKDIYEKLGTLREENASEIEVWIHWNVRIFLLLFITLFSACTVHIYLNLIGISLWSTSIKIERKQNEIPWCIKFVDRSTNLNFKDIYWNCNMSETIHFFCLISSFCLNEKSLKV